MSGEQPKTNFCPNCGNKIKAGEKFCPNCGQAIDHGAAEKPAEKKFLGLKFKRKRASSRAWGITLAAATLALYPIARFIDDYDTKVSAIGWDSFIIVVSFFVLVRRGINHLAKGSKFKKAMGWLALVIVLVVIASFTIVDLERDKIASQRDLLQSSATEAIYARSLADSDQTAAGIKAQNIMLQVYSYGVDPHLADYQKAIHDYANSIAAAQTQQDLQKIGPEPGDFKLSADKKDGERWLKDSLKTLAQIKQFGDAAIKRGDHESMKYVEARLHVQEHWLNGLDKGEFSSSEHGKVYAAASYRKDVCIQYKGGSSRLCPNELSHAIGPVIRTAHVYSTAKTNEGSKEWIDSWQKVAPMIGGAGVPIDAQLSPSLDPSVKGDVPNTVNDFFRVCKDKGGSLGNIKGENRLPTSEHGYGCNYRENGNACWGLITHSGQSFRGGEKGCPEQGLLPSPVEPVEKIVTKPKKPKQVIHKPIYKPKQQIDNNQQVSKNPYDGRYSLTVTSSHCDFNSGLRTDPFGGSNSGTIEVVDGVFYGNGQSIRINDNGTAQLTTSNQQSYGGGRVTVTIVTNFIFNRSGRVNGGWNTRATSPYNQTSAFLKCSGTFEGQRR